MANILLLTFIILYRVKGLYVLETTNLDVRNSKPIQDEVSDSLALFLLWLVDF